MHSHIVGGVRWLHLVPALMFATVAIAQQPAATCGPKASPSSAAAAFILAAETFYQQQQFDSAATVVRLGLSSCGTNGVDLAHLHVLDGILKIEALKDQEAHDAFAAALALNGDQTLPATAPPRARRIFEEVKSGAVSVVLEKLDAAFDARTDTVKDPEVAFVDRLVIEKPKEYEILWRAARYKTWYAQVAVPPDRRSFAAKNAVELGDRASALRPGDVRGHYFAALGLLRYLEQVDAITALAEGIKEQIRERLDRANTIDPSFERVGSALIEGRFLSVLPWPAQDLDKSREILAKLVQAHPDNAWARAYLADTLAKLGRVGDGRVEAEKVDPSSIKNAAETRLLAKFVADLKQRLP